MRILITGSDRALGRAAAEFFSPRHDLRLIDRVPDDPAEVLDGVDAILHLAAFEPAPCVDAAGEQDALMRATFRTYALCEAAVAAGVERVVVAGSLDVFDAYPSEYLVDEMWRPRPAPKVGQLAPYLCERVVREFVRAGGINGVGLRFRAIGDDPEANTRQTDALAAMEKALTVPLAAPGYRWHVIHVASSPRFFVRDARTKLGLIVKQEGGEWNPDADSHIDVPTTEPDSIRKVCVFGAGGPVGAAIAPLLMEHYTVCFTDIVQIEEFVAKEKSPGWPGWEQAPAAPHEWRLCDITDYGQVLQAMDGCDAVINLTVNRGSPELAFRINVVGTWNVMKAARALGVQRVIQSGPIARVNGYEGDYRYEYGVTADAPLRPGTLLYPHSKCMGHAIADAFAREAGLDVMTLLVSRLRPHDALDGRDDDVMISFSTAWDDLGPAFVKGLQAPRLPQPNEIFYICAELPFGKYSAEKAKRLLGWEAEHGFEQYYRRK
jgi:nucleoside-diphosphate-sugar epimerase